MIINLLPGKPIILEPRGEYRSYRRLFSTAIADPEYTDRHKLLLLLFPRHFVCGEYRSRTDDLLRARQAL